MRIFALIACLMITALGWSAGMLAAGDHTYNQPRWFDDRLDWCLTWGNDCGKPAADNFCKRRRFSSAGDFAPDPGIGHTRVSGTNQVCDGSFCTGFRFITCIGAIPADRVFANPVWKGHRLDNCLTWGTNCGKPAADAFCRSEGLADSIYSVVDPEPGRSSTRLIGTDQICDQDFCVGFQMITCALPPWVAVAINDAGGWGASIQPEGSTVAVPDALNRCGNNCRIAAQGPGRCVAVATSRTGGTWFGYAYGDDVNVVQSIAMKGCTDRAPGGCELAHVNCLETH